MLLLQQDQLDSEKEAVSESRLPLPYWSFRWNTIFTFIHKSSKFSVRTNYILVGGKCLTANFLLPEHQLINNTFMVVNIRPDALVAHSHPPCGATWP
ncbi:hypothetical protein E2C01_039771 [Portunus trituberculatus]|uniref:Uncharacterized protein n=1 Tax=Portunus trituberculatus TaxID=210409 RepID=A0A5B7FHV3_PORTR|nr:hypothetical protein [Portunus trituberculatus]